MEEFKSTKHTLIQAFSNRFKPSKGDSEIFEDKWFKPQGKPVCILEFAFDHFGSLQNVSKVGEYHSYMLSKGLVKFQGNKSLEKENTVQGIWT